MIQYQSATIKDGKFYSDKKMFTDRVSHLPDGKYIHQLIKVTDKNTRECQNYYFVFIGSWAVDFGWKKSDLHNHIKSDLFVQLFDEELSTTQLSQEQWTILFLNLENYLITLFEPTHSINS